MKKKDEDADFFKVTKKPAAGKKGSEQASGSKGPTAAEPAKKKLQHSLETLKTFMSFGVEVPQTTAELGATIEKVSSHPHLPAHLVALLYNMPAPVHCCGSKQVVALCGVCHLHLCSALQGG